MKKKHYLLTALASYLLLLIATIPAKQVTDLVNDNSPVYIQGVSGTLWEGKAYSITIDSLKLKKTTWSFNLLQLFVGDVSIALNTRLLDNDITANVGTSFVGRYFVNNMSAKLSAADVARLANIPLAQLDGTISLNIDNARWKQGEAPIATGEITWTNASVTVADTASLGNIKILLTESDQESLNAEINNQGGDIKIDGTAELAAESNYSLDVTLSPTATANNNIKQSLGLFAKKQADGKYRLKKSGSLNQIM